MRRFLVVSALFLSGFAQVSLAKHVTLHGYVTAVHSDGSFNMDEYKIIDRTEEERERIRSEGRDYRPPHLKPGSLRIGLEVEVKGDYDRKTGKVKATAIKAVNDDFDADKSLEGMGLIEEKSSVQKMAQGWSGRLKADGETLVLTSDTQISLKRSRKEHKERENLGLESDDVSSFSPEDIDLDTFAHYEGVRQADHSILAKKIEFRQDRAAAESDWNYLETTVTYESSHYDLGTLHVGQKDYQLFPSPEASTYLEKLGNSLIPAHQRELPEKSAGKVKFRFFLMKSPMFAVDTYPNGVIVVSENVLDVVENEAQLAFVLSHEIARVVEKQNWTTSKYRETERKEIEAAGLASTLVMPGAPLVGYLVERGVARKFVRGLQSQSDRVGMEYMLAAGFDPNQSVECWRVLAKKRPHGPFWGDSDENVMHRTYLQSELQLDYAGQDLTSLKRDSADFHAAADAVKAARVRAKTKKK
jgi:hypothetical protein